MATKKFFSTKWKNVLWLVLPVLAGIGIVFAAPLLKKGPQKVQIKERPVKVRTIKVSKIDVVARIVGYGRVAPARTWNAVAEVAGQVNWIAAELSDGLIVKSGNELLVIENSDYLLVLAQMDARLKASNVKSKAATDALVIANQELVLLQAEYDRKKQLAQKGTVSNATLQAAKRPMLAGRSKVANLQNTINLISAEHQVLIAQQGVAKLDLKRTRIKAPFDARITTVKIGVAQYANRGQLLFSADGIDVAEIAAQFPVGILRPLIMASNASGLANIQRGALTLGAIVRLRTPTHTVEWQAKVARVSGSIDPQTQSLGVVIAVDKPTELARPGKRPPLFRNTFVEVELVSTPIKSQITVPLNAIHQGKVYVVDSDSRLEKRNVKVRFSQKGYAVLAKGLKPGEDIVVSDLVTAIEGMLLAPQQDKKTKRAMIINATGKEPGKEPAK